jgi:3-oxoacyl-[acyl-carrier protein] reductase
VAAHNITVNCVAPGAIATDRLTDLMAARIAKSGQSEEEYNRDYLASIPAGRLGTPEEFAAVVAFLCLGSSCLHNWFDNLCGWR